MRCRRASRWVLYYVEWSLDLRAPRILLMALLTGVAFGVAPALGAAERRIVNPLRETAALTVTRLQRRVHSGLIVAHIGLTLLLLAAASLFVRTYAAQRSIPLGYDTSQLMTLRVYFAGPEYDSSEARARAVDAIVRGVQTLVGVDSATISDLVPLDDQGGSDSAVAIDGRSFEKGREPTIDYAGVAGQWPETFAVRLLGGRTFHDHELQGVVPVALVNAKLAATFWPGESAVGRRFRLAEDAASPLADGDWRGAGHLYREAGRARRDAANRVSTASLHLHTQLWDRHPDESQPGSVTADTRAVIRAVDPSLSLFDIYPMEKVRWLSYWMYVMWGTMFGVLALIALAIAAVGVYGVVFFTVAQRRREIGFASRWARSAARSSGR